MLGYIEMILSGIITVAGMVGIGVCMYKAGYKKGYDDGAVDGYSVKK